jgi:hypothetical protein
VGDVGVPAAGSKKAATPSLVVLMIEKLFDLNSPLEERSLVATLQFIKSIGFHPAVMSTEKRAASEDFGNSQMVVKRPNLGQDSKAVARVNGSGANGALIQAVCYLHKPRSYVLNSFSKI